MSVVTQTNRMNSGFRSGHGVDQTQALYRVLKVADWMDDKFRIPGTNRTVGLDGLLGLVPGIGDTISAAVSSYIIGESWRLGVPKRVLIRMGWNLAVDTVVGSIPLVGDLFDFAWKANRKNAHLLKKHLDVKFKERTSAINPALSS